MVKTRKESTACALFSLAGTTRLELATSTVTVWRSNQLSYAPSTRQATRLQAECLRCLDEHANAARAAKALEVLARRLIDAPIAFIDHNEVPPIPTAHGLRELADG